jgi:hypothetical protein
VLFLGLLCRAEWATKLIQIKQHTLVRSRFTCPAGKDATAGRRATSAKPFLPCTTPMNRTYLAQAERHIATVQERIARQKKIIDELAQAGQETDCAVSMPSRSGDVLARL